MYKLLIAGSRSFDDVRLLESVMDQIVSHRAPSVVITGGARGADALAARWAVARGFESLVVPADWDRFGKRAGFIRNQSMVSMIGRDDLVVLFYGPDGVSRGTAHTEDLAHKVGCCVRGFMQTGGAASKAVTY